jgi:hypothetical protein
MPETDDLVVSTKTDSMAIAEAVVMSADRVEGEAEEDQIGAGDWRLARGSFDCTKRDGVCCWVGWQLGSATQRPAVTLLRTEPCPLLSANCPRGWSLCSARRKSFRPSGLAVITRTKAIPACLTPL